MQPLITLQEDTPSRRRLHENPAILEFALGVVSQGRKRPFLIGGNDQPRLEQHLKAVADAENQPFPVAKFAQLLAEEMLELIGENLAGRHVVAIRESAGYDEDLIALQQLWVFAQAVDVETFGQPAGLCKRELRFFVAIGAGGTKDQDARLGHGIF